MVKRGGKGSKLEVKEDGTSYHIDIQSVLPKCPKESGTDKVYIGHFQTLINKKGRRLKAKDPSTLLRAG